MNFDAGFHIVLKVLDTRTRLVLIPVSHEYGVIAAVKPLGNGEAACVLFAPATKLASPFTRYRPTFLRKMITTDFALREGRWQELSVQEAGTLTLRTAVDSLIKRFDSSESEIAQEVRLDRPSNTSSAPDIAAATYRTQENVPIERSIAHLVGLDITMSHRHYEELLDATPLAIASEQTVTDYQKRSEVAKGDTSGKLAK